MSEVAEVASVGDVLNAYEIAPGHPVWLVPCAKCGQTHTHGSVEGHRTPHCPTGKLENYPDGYTLMLVGQADERLVASYYGAKRITKELAKLIDEEVRFHAFLKQRYLRQQSELQAGLH